MASLELLKLPKGITGKMFAEIAEGIPGRILEEITRATIIQNLQEFLKVISEKPTRGVSG